MGDKPSPRSELAMSMLGLDTNDLASGGSAIHAFNVRGFEALKESISPKQVREYIEVIKAPLSDKSPPTVLDSKFVLENEKKVRGEVIRVVRRELLRKKLMNSYSETYESANKRVARSMQTRDTTRNERREKKSKNLQAHLEAVAAMKDKRTQKRLDVLAGSATKQEQASKLRDRTRLVHLQRECERAQHYSERHSSYVNKMEHFEENLYWFNDTSEKHRVEVGTRHRDQLGEIRAKASDNQRKFMARIAAKADADVHLREAIEAKNELSAKKHYKKDQQILYDKNLRLTALRERMKKRDDRIQKTLSVAHQLCSDRVNRQIEEYNQKQVANDRHGKKKLILETANQSRSYHKYLPLVDAHKACIEKSNNFLMNLRVARWRKQKRRQSKFKQAITKAVRYRQRMSIKNGAENARLKRLSEKLQTTANQEKFSSVCKQFGFPVGI